MRSISRDDQLQTVFQSLKSSLSEYRLLLDSDPRFPSVVSIIAGKPVRGSWWGHPMGYLINEVGGILGGDADVLLTKLLSGKVTYIHRELWSPFFAIATSKESWQLEGLSESAVSLLKELESREELRTNELSLDTHVSAKLLGESARELERRLLVYGRGFHTSSGYHAKLLKNWAKWAKGVGFVPRIVATADAKSIFESRVDILNERFGAKARLPWRPR